MDEITIDEKKYISSKRAAELTGYAKDYVGQLCREGYVKATRVGRSWYVLEAAILDHRFDAQKAAEAPIGAQESDAKRTPPESGSRYQAIVAEDIPPIEAKEKDVPVLDAEPDVENIHSAWQAWFDSFAGLGVSRPAQNEQDARESMPHEAGADALEREDSEEQPIAGIAGEDTEPIEAGEAIISMRPLPEEEPLAPRIAANVLDIAQESRQQALSEKPARKRSMKAYGGTMRICIQGMLLLIMLISIALSAVSSGYFDSKLISYKQAASFAGISIYKK